MAAVLNVLGFIFSTVLGIIPIALSDDNVPSTNDPLAAGNSLVRLGIGFNANPALNDTTGGPVPGIIAYNELEENIGIAPSSYSSLVRPGAWVTIIVNQQGLGRTQQPTYLEIAGADGHPICISYIGQTWSDGTRLGWIGDIGAYCKKPWYYSDLYVTMANGTFYKPRCMWIGQGTISNGSQPAVNVDPAFWIHTPDFGRQTTSGGISVPEDPSKLCGPPYMEFLNQSNFNTLTKYTSAGSRTRVVSFLAVMDFFGVVAGAIAKRVPKFVDQPQVKKAFGGTLVRSYHAQHTGKEICANEFSLGPDFVSFSDNTFCDMETKTAWPLCDAEHSKRCFDWETKSILIGMFRKRELRYRKVIEWK